MSTGSVCSENGSQGFVQSPFCLSKDSPRSEYSEISINQLCKSRALNDHLPFGEYSNFWSISDYKVTPAARTYLQKFYENGTSDDKARCLELLAELDVLYADTYNDELIYISPVDLTRPFDASPDDRYRLWYSSDEDYADDGVDEEDEHEEDETCINLFIDDDDEAISLFIKSSLENESIQMSNTKPSYVDIQSTQQPIMNSSLCSLRFVTEHPLTSRNEDSENNESDTEVEISVDVYPVTILPKHKLNNVVNNNKNHQNDKTDIFPSDLKSKNEFSLDSYARSCYEHYLKQLQRKFNTIGYICDKSTSARANGLVSAAKLQQQFYDCLYELDCISTSTPTTMSHVIRFDETAC